MNEVPPTNPPERTSRAPGTGTGSLAGLARSMDSQIQDREAIQEALASIGALRHQAALHPKSFSAEEQSRILRAWRVLDSAVLRHLQEDFEEGITDQDAIARLARRHANAGEALRLAALEYLANVIASEPGQPAPSEWSEILEYFDVSIPGWRETYRQEFRQEPTPEGLAALVRRESGGALVASRTPAGRSFSE